MIIIIIYHCQFNANSGAPGAPLEHDQGGEQAQTSDLGRPFGSNGSSYSNSTRLTPSSVIV